MKTAVALMILMSQTTKTLDGSVYGPGVDRHYGARVSYRGRLIKDSPEMGCACWAFPRGVWLTAKWHSRTVRVFNDDVTHRRHSDRIDFRKRAWDLLTGGRNPGIIHDVEVTMEQSKHSDVGKVSASPKRILSDVRVLVGLERPDWWEIDHLVRSRGMTTEEAVATLTLEWAQDFEKFVRDHCSQGLTRVTVVKTHKEVCTACGEAWEPRPDDLQDGKVVCAHCGEPAEEAQP